MEVLAHYPAHVRVIRSEPALDARPALGGQAPASVTVDIETMRKDLRTMVEEARAAGFELPVTARALECYDDVVKQGGGGRDITTFAVRKLR